MNYRTCVTVAERTPKGLARAAGMALKRSELAELRLDFLEPRDVPEALRLARGLLPRCVCTLRPRSEGGMFPGGEPERAAILKLVAEYGPFLLDVEFDTLRRDGRLAGYLSDAKADVLVSWHDFEGTPPSRVLERKLATMAGLSSNVKMVTTALSLEDSARVLGLYRARGNASLVAFCMGDKGRMSRILCLYLGSPYTYVSLGRPVAPGQFSIAQLEGMGRRSSRWQKAAQAATGRPGSPGRPS